MLRNENVTSTQDQSLWGLKGADLEISLMSTTMQDFIEKHASNPNNQR